VSDIKPYRILAVDDDPALLFLLRTLLEETGYQVLTASDGESAIACATADKPDLILLDIHMPPGMDGLAVCAKLRKIPETRKIRVIFLTAFDTDERLEQAIKMGGNDFLGKPINTVELRLRIQAMLETNPRLDETLPGKPQPNFPPTAPPPSPALSHHLGQKEIASDSFAVAPKPQQSQVLSKARADHEIFASAMESIHRLFNGSPAPDATQQFANIQQLITEKIPQHFAYEEKHVFPSLAAENPNENVAHIVSELCQDHGRLLEAAQRLRPLLDQRNPVNYTNELWPVLLEFISDLFNHATKEDQLFKLFT